MPLTVHREHRDQFTVITMIGELDANGLGTLGEDLDLALCKGAPRLLFDMSELNFIDSSGLRLLVSACAQATRHGGTCALCSLRPMPRTIMNVTGLGAVFDIYPTKAAALAGGPLESPASRRLP
ncbi:STAS domain-containing protein [Sphaerisporangium aureirubrum]|uniref:Anti-sigma factor antagonist n=1 Tax=Sphaerisporangium aureirubrum TaxID=1544736 RepID=A0ABW1NEP0_9ACTN